MKYDETKLVVLPVLVKKQTEQKEGSFSALILGLGRNIIGEREVSRIE